MEKKKNEIEQLSNKIFERMRAGRDIFPFLKLLEDEQLLLQYKALVYMKSIATKSMQIGNYRRAMLMLLGMENILSNIELAEDEIKEKVSAYILDESG